MAGNAVLGAFHHAVDQKVHHLGSVADVVTHQGAGQAAFGRHVRQCRFGQARAHHAGFEGCEYLLAAFVSHLRSCHGALQSCHS